VIAGAFASETAFRSWMRQNARTYASSADYIRRYAVYLDNVEMVKDLKAQGFGVTLNKFADMTREEFRATYLTYSPVGAHITDKPQLLDVKAPASLDYSGYLTVQDQGSCGSCWAFCIASQMEGRGRKEGVYTGGVISQQQLVDCDTYDSGCNGGHPLNTYRWVKKNGGLMLATDYPYTAKKGTCKQDTAKNVLAITSSTRVTNGDETALLDIVYQNGPLAIGMDASRSSFSFYDGTSVYNDTKCSSTAMNHCVTLCGYGNLSGTDYWLVLNSWGTSWGANGYFKLARNSGNRCGVGNDTNYATVVKA